MSQIEFKDLKASSSASRTSIFERLGPVQTPTALERPAVAPRMPLDGNPVEHFLAKLTSERLTATVQRLSSTGAIPAAIKAYLDQHAITSELAIADGSPLCALDWAGMETSSALSMDQEAAVTWADYAVAETGSLVLLSSPTAPLLYNMLPLHHICVVRRTSLLSYSEDLWACLAHEQIAMPRSLMFLTGTSGTADIEAKNVRGAHGPRYLHVVLLEDT